MVRPCIALLLIVTDTSKLSSAAVVYLASWRVACCVVGGCVGVPRPCCAVAPVMEMEYCLTHYECRLLDEIMY